MFVYSVRKLFQNSHSFTVIYSLILYRTSVTIIEQMIFLIYFAHQTNGNNLWKPWSHDIQNLRNRFQYCKIHSWIMFCCHTSSGSCKPFVHLLRFYWCFPLHILYLHKNDTSWSLCIALNRGKKQWECYWSWQTACQAVICNWGLNLHCLSTKPKADTRFTLYCHAQHSWHKANLRYADKDTSWWLVAQWLEALNTGLNSTDVP